MNKSYRSIYNEQTDTWVAVSEVAKCNGKKTKCTLGIAAIVTTGLFAFSNQANAVANSGIYVNDGTDNGCGYFRDLVTNPASTVTNVKCTVGDAATQVNRTVFFNPDGAGTTEETNSLTLGNRLYVNGGKIWLNDKRNGTDAMMIGNDGTTATGANAIAIGNNSFAGISAAGTFGSIAMGVNARAETSISGSSIAIGSNSLAV